MYVKLLERVEKKGDDFVNREIERLEHLLEKKDVIEAHKRDSIYLRLNILKTFSSN